MSCRIVFENLLIVAKFSKLMKYGLKQGNIRFQDEKFFFEKLRH